MNKKPQDLSPPCRILVSPQDMFVRKAACPEELVKWADVGGGWHLASASLWVRVTMAGSRLECPAECGP